MQILDRIGHEVKISSGVEFIECKVKDYARGLVLMCFRELVLYSALHLSTK